MNQFYELDQFAQRENTNVTFNKEARDKFLTFAKSPAALWSGNFRDLSGSLQRMATLATTTGARITLDLVDQEIHHLQSLWHDATVTSGRETDNNGILEKFLSRTQLQVMEWQEEQGADVNAKDKDGVTPR